MSNTNSSNNNGIRLAPVLFLVFLVLKLTHEINWSRWWITAPLWGGIALWLGMLVFLGILAVVFGRR